MFFNSQYPVRGAIRYLVKITLRAGGNPHNDPEIHREIIWFPIGGVSTPRTIISDWVCLLSVVFVSFV